MKYRFYILWLLLLSATSLQAQPEHWADRFYTSGKIYVVAGCLLLILAGIIFYLIRIDRKLKKLEKEIDEHRS